MYRMIRGGYDFWTKKYCLASGNTPDTGDGAGGYTNCSPYKHEKKGEA